MNATLPAVDVSNARQPNKKELVRALSLVVVKKSEIQEVVTIRCYMGRSSSASVVYACIWVRVNGGRYTSGRGQAGGYGYHKISAAIGDAITSAGIKLDQDIDGRGDSSVREAMEAIGVALGYRNARVVSHG